ncbi:hypothetical protein MLD38_038746 [Melastoma candidum]|uniref:Uncharacterized protein n=1 Tax=Melastoma candidum TaxID=119954 RepID=A0ACB9L0L5_9MYRT|nr:hypothetical protein MLD38_038746 [Melastoma candidum]
MALEQLKWPDRLLSAQNEMLKRNKTNLDHEVAELDDMVGELLGINTQKMLEQKTRAKQNGPPKTGAADSSKRLMPSEKLNSQCGIKDLVDHPYLTKKPPFTSKPLMR